MKRKRGGYRTRVYGSKAYKSTGRMLLGAVIEAYEEAAFRSGLETAHNVSTKFVARLYHKAARLADRLERYMEKHGIL